MADPITIVVLEGDETGQELLEQSLRLLEPDLLQLDLDLQRFDLSLESRRRTSNGVVTEAAAAMREAGLGLKAATITPEGADDVGSPNRILREEVGGKVIIRTGRRLPGVTPIAGVYHPISVVRMAVEDAYGAKQWREGTADAPDEVAFRTERITRSTCRAVSEYAFRTAARMNARVYGGPKWTVSPVYEGMLKEEMDAAAKRHPDVEYQPVLIDATYAGLLSGATDAPLVIPALNRDGDCLSDLVLPMYGSIAGAESILLAFDDDYNTTVAMAEAPHGTAPALQGKDVANPLAMILACGALLRQAAEQDAGATAQRSGIADQPSGDAQSSSATARPSGATERAARAIYEAALETIGAGIKTPDLGGHAGTTEFTDGVIERVRNKLEVWSSLGSAA
jgi:3-isopropylmalate dehydrogenase